MTLGDLASALAAAGAPPEAIKIALDAFTEALDFRKEKLSRQEQNRRAYLRLKTLKAPTENAESALNNAENDAENLLKNAENSPSRIRAPGLCGEEVILKELPTVVRKTEPVSQAEADLFAEGSSPIDLRSAKKAADSRTLDFVGEGWNALCLEFPRMARVSVIPDKSSRERQILARTKDLLKDFDFHDMESGWRAFFGRIRGSPFLRGEAPPSGSRPRPFKPTLDALTAPEMFLKIMENHYGEEVFKRSAAAQFAGGR